MWEGLARTSSLAAENVELVGFAVVVIVVKAVHGVAMPVDLCIKPPQRPGGGKDVKQLRGCIGR